MSSTFIHKAAATARVSTTTLADDPDITCTLTAGKAYRIRAVLRIVSGATPDFKYRWHFTGTLTHSLVEDVVGHVLVQPSTTGAPRGDTFSWTGTRLTDGTTVAVLNGSATADHRGVVYLEALIVPATTGTFSLQWAQNTSNAWSAQVLSASWLWAEEIETTTSGLWGGVLSVLTSDTSMSASTTLTDSGLSLDLDANSTYLVEVRANIQGGTAEDFKVELNSSVALSASGGAGVWINTASLSETEQSMEGSCLSTLGSNTIGVAGAAGTTLVGVVSGAGATYYAPQYCLMLVLTGASAPTLKLRYAQITSGATATKVTTGSHMFAEKIA